MTWEDGPATWKQLKFLREHGYALDHRLTKSEASALIRDMGGPPESQTSQTRQTPQLKQETETVAQGAYHFRAQVENAKRATSGANKNGSGASSVTLETAAAAQRREFWTDTCRDVTHMRAGSTLGRDLYRKHGCLFDAPTQVQVQEILDALDSALPFWDRDHPELFFETLRLNFPQLLRHR